MALDASAVAAAVAKEIERQQAAVVYDDLSVDDLSKVVAQLQSKLELCKEALTKRGADAGPARKAVKSEGTWPERPWGGTDLSILIRPCLQGSAPELAWTWR